MLLETQLHLKQRRKNLDLFWYEDEILAGVLFFINTNAIVFQFITFHALIYMLCIQSNFETGNQIQLVSKTSGRSLRIAEARSGKLVADGRGDIGEQAWNGQKYLLYSNLCT